jgi:hypothetical protein
MAHGGKGFKPSGAGTKNCTAPGFMDTGLMVTGWCAG